VLLLLFEEIGWEVVEENGFSANSDDKFGFPNDAFWLPSFKTDDIRDTVSISRDAIKNCFFLLTNQKMTSRDDRVASACKVNDTCERLDLVTDHLAGHSGSCAVVRVMIWKFKRIRFEMNKSLMGMWGGDCDMFIHSP
jgi:hypothetical protein